MFCRNCGKELTDNAKFCNFCGSQQKPIVSNIADKDLNTDAEKTQKSFFSTFAFIIHAIILFIIVVIAVVSFDSSSNTQSPTSSTSQDNTRNAKTSDLIITFQKIDSYFEHDNYYITIQAQEKITDLTLEINYKTSSGKIIKTKALSVGKVVPGNEYKFELDQNGIDPDYVDKTSTISYTIASGTVIDTIVSGNAIDTPTNEFTGGNVNVEID